MKYITSIIAAVMLAGCVSTGPRSGGDAASRSNGNATVNINDNAATQGADKTVEALGGNSAGANLNSPGGTNTPTVAPDAGDDTPATDTTMTPAEIENRALRKRVADLEAGTAP